jgi:hypothetical protein
MRPSTVKGGRNGRWTIDHGLRGKRKGAAAAQRITASRMNRPITAPRLQEYLRQNPLTM